MCPVAQINSELCSWCHDGVRKWLGFIPIRQLITCLSVKMCRAGLTACLPSQGNRSQHKTVTDTLFLFHMQHTVTHEETGNSYGRSIFSSAQHSVSHDTECSKISSFEAYALRIEAILVKGS